MEVTVKHNNLRRSPGKIRPVLYIIKGKPAKDAIDILRFTNKGVAPELVKLVKAGMAAAKEREMSEEKLTVKIIKCDGAGMYKRHRFGSRGRVYRIEKRNSHLTLTLSDEAITKKDVKTEKDAKAIAPVAEKETKKAVSPKKDIKKADKE